jgi:DNA ligase-associated metallophosphoesterase
MSLGALQLDRRGLTLLPQRAVWQGAAHTLWIADPHFGKTAAFRALGQPVPGGSTRENLRRLGALVDSCGARRLVVLGDFLHARAGRNDGIFAQLAAWRAARPQLECLVVRGNHDLHAGDVPRACGFEAVDEPFVSAGVEGWHHPDAAATRSIEGPVILSGHLHPVARLSGPGRDRLRLPCFCLRGREIVLPAFGEFTGGHPVSREDWRELVLTTGAALFSLAGRAAADFAGQAPSRYERGHDHDFPAKTER